MKAVDLSRILNSAEDKLSEAIRADGRPGKTGGYLCVADKAGVILVCQVGEVTDLVAAERYRFNCQEKALRVLKNPEHISSWQSRDTEGEVKKYGGGIKTGDGIAIAFSGFTEWVDEAFSAVIAHYSVFAHPFSSWICVQNESKNPHMDVYGEMNPVAVKT